MPQKPGVSGVLEKAEEVTKKTGEGIVERTLEEGKEFGRAVLEQIVGSPPNESQVNQKVKEEQEKEIKEKRFKRALHEEAHRLGQVSEEELRMQQRDRQREQLEEQSRLKNIEGKSKKELPPLEENTQLLPTSADKMPRLFGKPRKKKFNLSILRRGTYETTKKAA